MNPGRPESRQKIQRAVRIALWTSTASRKTPAPACAPNPTETKTPKTSSAAPPKQSTSACRPFGYPTAPRSGQG